MKSMDKLIIGVIAVLLVGMGGVFITAMSNGGEVQNVDSGSTSRDVLLKELTPADAEAIALNAVPGTILDVEVENENGKFIYEVNIKDGNLERSVKVDQNGGIIGIETEEEDVPITGTSLEQASAAALAYIGEGRVTDSEVGDEEGYYEIEITLDNGGEVDVHLDQNFRVLSTEYD